MGSCAMVEVPPGMGHGSNGLLAPVQHPLLHQPDWVLGCERGHISTPERCELTMAAKVQLDLENRG